VPQTPPRILIVGAGIFGSAIAYHLAVGGADVVLLEAGPAPGCGVTGRAFGWINVVNRPPHHPGYALLKAGFDAYRDPLVVPPQMFEGARSGSLIWHATAAETEDFGLSHRQAGEEVELLDRKALARLEPGLRNPPELAVLSTHDLALDPARLAAAFVDAAVQAGATVRFGQDIVAVEQVDGRPVLRSAQGGVMAADRVVLAAGSGTGRLMQALGVDIGVRTAPALLLRYACSVPVTSRILRMPRLEMRQAPDHTLVVAASYVDDGSDDLPRRMGEARLAVMREEFDLPETVTLSSAEVGQRPTFDDDLPRLGFVPQVSGLYLAVGHPGIILAPLFGRLAADEMLRGKPADLAVFGRARERKTPSALEGEGLR
jgi:glycine/D-amino acid oxidase-like deaminating enzyme